MSRIVRDIDNDLAAWDLKGLRDQSDSHRFQLTTKLAQVIGIMATELARELQYHTCRCFERMHQKIFYNFKDSFI